MLWVAISLSFSKVNERADIFARPVFFRLGAFSLMIFLNQFYVIRLVEYLLPQLTFAWKVVVCTAFTMLGGLLCENIVNRKHYGK